MAAKRSRAKKGKSATRAADAPMDGELFLIDGNSLAYRAFYALPESMATHDGRPTNAIYGFASMLAKIVADFSPGAIVVAWDAGMSGREKAYEPYKSQRKPRPDLLSEQWPHLPEVVEAFGFVNVRVEGYEADDVIGTLAARSKEAGIPVTVVSGDRDVYQLVTDGVRVMATSKGVSEVTIYDREEVQERYGVPPERVPDLIGLRGDTSDNIPGVPGIGDKTAAQLLSEFGTLEDVLASVEEISGAKRKQALVDHADDARTSKQLATIITDIDTGVDLPAVMEAEPDRSRLREVARDFELRKPLERLEAALGAGSVPADEGSERLEAAAAAGGLDDIPEGQVAVAVGDSGWAVADAESGVAGPPVEAAELAAALSGRPLVGHDLKSLGGGSRQGLIAHAGTGGLELEHDTMVAAYLLDPGRRSYALGELAAQRGLSASSEADPGQMALDGDEGADPAADARLVWEIADRQRSELADSGLSELFEQVEMPLIEVLAEMERIGIKLDVKRLEEIGKDFEKRIGSLQKSIWKLAGREFTIGSPQQLAEVLFGDLKLTPKRRGKTGYSTDARVLQQIRAEHEIVGKVEQWRELTKLKSTYLDALPQAVDSADGRIHTTFNQAATATGRLSSTDPNLQNVPVRSEEGRPIRSCFVAERGKRLLAADYDQVEMRILAKVAGEEALLEIFAKGEDIHTATAAEVLDLDPDDVGQSERSKAKMVNYGIAYGLSAFGLADRLGIEQEEAAAYIERYFERFPGIRRYMDETVAKAKKDGYVTTLLGRRRPIPELRSDRPQVRSQGERLAINMPIQGTSADVIKLAMLRTRSALAEQGLETRLILQIHDELLFEGPTAEMEGASEIVEREMTGALEIEPALTVGLGVGRDWLSAK